MPEFVCVQTYNNRAEAEMAKGHLESQGVPAFVSADDAGGLYPALQQVAKGVRLMVAHNNLKEAKEILEK